MKITYNKNPLFTTIELDEHEKEIFRYKILVNELEEMIHEAHFTLTNHDWWNSSISKDGKDKPMRTHQDTMKEAMGALDPEYWCGDVKGQSKLDARVDELLNYHLNELQSSHGGDCTCVACSCCKCHAEGLLGTDTLSGLGKHKAYKILSAFGGYKNDKTLDEALAHLRDYVVGPFTGQKGFTEESWNGYRPRWESEYKAAYEWLQEYANQHFPKE